MDAAILASLPAPWPADNLRALIRRRHLELNQTLVVVDDDPTGCQSVADVPLLLEWSTAALAAGQRISQALCAVVQALPLRPAYIVAKGGITSHELAQRGLGCQRATVLGQAAPGVPAWRLDRAKRFEKLPYVVFPGNVGQPGTLAELVGRLAAATSRSPTSAR